MQLMIIVYLINWGDEFLFLAIDACMLDKNIGDASISVAYLINWGDE